MPVTTKGRRTEEALLDAARRVFAEKGFHNAKISDITSAAGRSAGSFYNYYENKEQLLEALLEQFSTEVLEEALRGRASDGPYEGIRAAVAAYLHTYRRYLPEMVGLFEMSTRDPVFTERWRQHRAVGIRAIVTGLRRLERDEQREVDLDHGPLASALVSMLESYCWTWMAAGGDADVDEPDDAAAIDLLSAIWYRAVFAGSEPEDRAGPTISSREP